MPSAAGVNGGLAPLARQEEIRGFEVGLWPSDERADFLRWLAASLICRSSYREKA